MTISATRKAAIRAEIERLGADLVAAAEGIATRRRLHGHGPGHD